MCPRLFYIGPFPVYSFGLMLGISFIVASLLLTSELKRKKLDPELGSTITLIALFGGVAGSKILFLIEEWRYFLSDPIGMAFSPGGLTWYGGFLLVAVLLLYLAKKKKIAFLTIADATSPGLLWAYGIARIGCHLSGDGDYGFPTTLPWGTNYSNGTYPPSLALRGFPEITSKFPNGIVPDTTPCHPTPIYEFIICTILFFILWKNRRRIIGTGRMFLWYLVAAGSERFAIEFLRLNPRLLLGLSEAQLIAIVLIVSGIVGLRIIPTGKTGASS
ncbi:MAG TPA: prolipoprotein diacylglyceryl transferase family protein [Bacteroidota bacterium]|nr:prolipoprotein diacylglyceryl transferase family protein [Bacteroidota bacterium]